MPVFVKTGSIVLAALTAIALPLQSASAHQQKVVMAVRNDEPVHANVTVPARLYPPAGTCRLWYPDRDATQQPAVSSCNVVIPAGAILILG